MEEKENDKGLNVILVVGYRIIKNQGKEEK